jgi:hypothetical protein
MSCGFTKRELIKAASAAEIYPPGLVDGWGVDRRGKGLGWHELDNAKFL